MPDITVAELRRVFHYDPETGLFTWRIKPPHQVERPGDLAGGWSQGYLRLRWRGKRYMAHRVAYLFMTGTWPDRCIDHIDRNPSNNRWANLRPASVSDNCLNSFGKSRCQLPRGVSPAKNGFRGELRAKGKRYITPICKTAEEASVAYEAIARRVKGEFYPR